MSQADEVRAILTTMRQAIGTSRAAMLGEIRFEAVLYRLGQEIQEAQATVKAMKLGEA